MSRPMDRPAASVGTELEPEDLEGFDDFTIASSWERFIASVEATCREWQAAGPAKLVAAGAESLGVAGKLHRVHKEVSFGVKLYVVILFFQASTDDDEIEEWGDNMHHLQLWFGVQDFLVAAPVSMNGVVLDASEATMLLSTVAVALSSCGSDWPVFVPVHDPTRKAYKGIQATRSSYSTNFEADRIGSWVPVRFMHLEGLYELFVSKVAFTAPNSSAIPALRVGFTLRLTYRTPIPGFEYQMGSHSPTAEAVPDYDGDLPDDTLWDEDCPWAEWHSVDDPVKGFELIAIWKYKFVSAPWEMPEYENMSTFDADTWLLGPIFAKERNENQREEGYAGRLEALVMSFQLAGEADFMEDFSTVAGAKFKTVRENFVVPPATVLQRVVKDLFYEVPSVSRDTEAIPGCFDHAVKGAPSDSLFGRFCLHCLRFGSCNIRAIAVLWIEFVREVRWCWDESQPLPRVSAAGPPDLSTTLLHQKLQLLATCIELKGEDVAKFAAGGNLQKLTKNTTSVSGEQDPATTDVLDLGKKPINLYTAELKSSAQKSVPNYDVASIPSSLKDDSQGMSNFSPKIFRAPKEVNESPDATLKDEAVTERRGSAGPIKDWYLLKSKLQLHAPVIQKPPLMTEDMMQEREKAIAALSKSPSEKVARARLQTDILASDMGAFKAANPGAIFEDFVRWHSPQDWLECEGVEISGNGLIDDKGATWPSQGKLSQRFSKPNNTWFEIWEIVPPQPASEQKLLFDYRREGEKVIHYLDTLKPQQLLAQIICTAFIIAADSLQMACQGRSPRLDVELEELHSLIDRILQPLESLSNNGEAGLAQLELWHKDMLQLCRVFAHVEGNVFVAVSMFQKLKQSPHLFTALIDNYLDNGKSRQSILLRSASCQSQRKGALDPSNEERKFVADLFSPATAVKSRLKSSRMGNFLNGHEPVIREVKFKFHGQDCYGHKQHVESGSTFSDIPSHKMYICGTSDDLQVALSVLSRD